MTSSYVGYCVANSICASSKSKQNPPEAENCCNVACRVPQSQSPRDSRDELIAKKISSRDSSNTLVASPTAESEFAYTTQWFRFPSFKMWALKQFGVRRTVARSLDVPVVKPLSVHNLCSNPMTTDVICTRDFTTLRAAPRTDFYSALDLTSTRHVSYAHRGLLKSYLASIAQVATHATARDAHDYNSSRTPRTRHLIKSSKFTSLIAIAIFDLYRAIVRLRCLLCSIASMLSRSLLLLEISCTITSRSTWLSKNSTYASPIRSWLKGARLLVYSSTEHSLNCHQRSVVSTPLR